MSWVVLNIVIIGRSGQVAWELQRCLPEHGRVLAVGRPEVDLANAASVREMVRRLRPDVLVNAGAYTAVDQAESEPEQVMAINGVSPGIMAEEAKRINALFISYSTDYVFDGSKASPYSELDTASPLGVYGASKLAGDRAVESLADAYLIFRTSWVYGPQGKNFLRTIMKLAVERDEIRVVDDQVGAPTWSRDIAQATRQILAQLVGTNDRLEPLGGRRGIYNMTSQGSVSWCGFARAILEEMRGRGANDENLARIVPIPTHEYPTAAVRPRNSRLSNDKIQRVFGVALPGWRPSLAGVMEEVGIGRGGVSASALKKPADTTS